MLSTLSIRDFVIVDHLELDLSTGFSVLTGETGAGKSILIDALTLTLGGRADAGVVKEGANKADITATFTITEAVYHWLDEQTLAESTNEVLMRRVIDSAGRSKAFINGISVTVSQLKALGEQLVDIHGQHAHQSLLKLEQQRTLLDNQAGLQSQVKAVAKAYGEWQEQIKKYEQAERDQQFIAAQKERLVWSVETLEKLSAQPDEWQQISQEHRRMSHSAALIATAQEALDVLSETDSPVMRQLSSQIQKLDKLTDIDQRFQGIVDMLEPARIQVQEAVYALHDYLGKADFDAVALAALEERLNALHGAAKQFNVLPEALPATYLQLKTQLTQLDQNNDITQLKAAVLQAESVYMKLAQALSVQRQKAAKQFSTVVTQSMQSLSMQGGQFDIDIHPDTAASYGIDHIEFLVSGHEGVSPKPLVKVASGGELARIALAISVMASTATATPTLIFDEVDSGVGGAVAEVVGHLLKQLGSDRQVLCVTHLPQVASQANHHFKVEKTQQHGQTSSHIRLLSDAERIEEVARMLGGVEITSITREHAKELLAQD